MKHYDVLVVGLGAVGSAAVHHLTAMGTSVLGIDRYAPPHPYGSTHGDTRITREAVGEGEVYVPFVRRSHELWHELEHETSTAVLHRTGGLLVRPASVTASMHGADDFLRSTIDVAVAHGGTSIEDPPGPRSGPAGVLHLAYVRDPDGNKLCALHRPKA